MNFFRNIIVVFVCALSPLGYAETDLNQLMQKWIQLESQKGNLQIEWAERKTELDRRQQLLTTEKASLKETLAQAEGSTSDVDQRRNELLSRQEKLEKEQATLSLQINKAASFLEIKKNQMPPPLAEEITQKLVFLNQSGLSQSERLEKLLSIYKLISEFDQRVAINKSKLEIPAENEGHKTLQVTQIFLGLSQGWYLSDDASQYGYGRATELGWKWWSNEEVEQELGQRMDLSELKNLIAIAENPTLADLVTLPIKLDNKAH